MLSAATFKVMFTHLEGIDVGLLPRGDFNGMCQTLFVHLHRHDPIRGARFPLFDRAVMANDTDFLG